MIFENLRVKDITAIVRYTPPRVAYKWKSRGRFNHYLGIMLSGSAHHDFGYKDFTSTKNCIFFYNRKDFYDVTVIEPGESYAVYFTTDEEIETESFCIPVQNPDEFINLLSKLENLKNTSDGGELLLLSTFYKLCNEVHKSCKKEYFHKETRIEKAKCYMDINFKSPDCLSKAVEESGLSARRFNDLFKNNFKITPNRYLTQRKVEYAKCLLETNNITVTEVAILSGFSDVYYFSKVFKRIYGVTPSKWNT